MPPPIVDEKGQFVKGHPRLPGAGMKRGSQLRNTKLLKDAILLAGGVGANILVAREIIERQKAEAEKKDGKLVADELEKCVAQNGALVGYLAWLSINHPNAYASLLGRVLPLEAKIDSHKEVVYKTVDDIKREIEDMKLPMDRILPLLLDVEKFTPRTTQDQATRATDAILDDPEVDRGS
jgi:hypothetical protein